jgi:hypothetical protein
MPLKFESEFKHRDESNLKIAAACETLISETSMPQALSEIVSAD